MMDKGNIIDCKNVSKEKLKQGRIFSIGGQILLIKHNKPLF